MAVHRLGGVIHELRRRTTPNDPGDDGELLGSFIDRRDERAFAALVHRHGPMVWGVCRRLAGHHQDAEDAFQATFLVLARKAGSVRPRRMVANWLFGVARRVALKAKVMSAKRQAREQQVPTMPEADAARRAAWGDLESLIDRELAALPDKYRVAVVLCDLEGKKGKDAARQLGIPEGTLASRLRTGRVMLAKRLSRHGIPLSAGAVAAAVGRHAASASVPARLASSAIRAGAQAAAGHPLAAGMVSANVASLTEGVMKAMLLRKLGPVLGVVLVAGLAAFGGGPGTRPAAAGKQATAADPEREAAPKRQPAPGSADASPPASTRESPTDVGRKIGAASPDGRSAVIVYAVADLVVPIRGLDVPAAQAGDGKTKEDWLIRKVTRTVAPASWEAAGGTGTIEYYPVGRSLVVRNTPRVLAQVSYLLETMRRVQDVQVTAEVRVVSITGSSFRQLQGLLPQLKLDGHAVLGDAEAFALLRKAQDDAATRVAGFPKVTFFPGQRVNLSLGSDADRSAVEKADVKLHALVAANLNHLELEVTAAVGKADFVKTVWLEDGGTLAQVRRDGDGYRILLVTPRVILSPPDEPEGAAARPTEAPKAARAPDRPVGRPTRGGDQNSPAGSIWSVTASPAR